eukprot:GHUV01041495.1.p2 GENE.GHUV01041495.1~~GHUV01041495.1.p2  ORF type:complete len:110 (-),score=30.91 GHUV01041495.1:270-599(-)
MPLSLLLTVLTNAACLVCSGGTAEYPGLLQYSCDLQTNVMPVAPMQIDLPKRYSSSSSSASKQQKQQQHPEVLDTLLSGKPLVCLAFSDMLVSLGLSMTCFLLMLERLP